MSPEELFRLIPYRHFDAYTNMALDEAIMESVRAGRSAPTVRLYGWTPSAISIGYFQGLHYEVNVAACRAAGVEVVRRLTGGGAVYHDTAGEVTYSLIAPERLYPRDILASYQIICGYVVAALRDLGLDASFQPINDIAVEGKKISGNAQTRRGGILLQHGTVLYRVDVETMFSLLTVSEVKVSDKVIQSVRKRVTSLEAYTAASREALIAALERAFSQGLRVERGDYTPAELARAAELAETKYRTEAWKALR